MGQGTQYDQQTCDHLRNLRPGPRRFAQRKETARDETGKPSALLSVLRVAHSHKLEKLQRAGRMLDKNLTTRGD